jgi:predicted TIM-barrel fold metal-dependent hydrolase
MGFIDAHVHVWSDDLARYPRGPSLPLPADAPAAFSPETLLGHARPAGVERINLIQISFYGFDNTCMLEAMTAYPDVFVGTAVVDPFASDVDRTMTDLGHCRIRAFRIHPRLSQQPPATWLQPEGYRAMFATAAHNGQAMSCLIEPDGFAELDRMCTEFPETPVVIDHLGRIGLDGTIRDADVDALCALAKHAKIHVKVGGFYALGKKQPPYDDLAPLIERVVRAFGPERCMWESDSPFQTLNPHTYQASIDVIQRRLPFLTASDKESILCKTAERFYFAV